MFLKSDSRSSFKFAILILILVICYYKWFKPKLFVKAAAFLNIRPALFLLAKVISRRLHENRSFEKWCLFFDCKDINKQSKKEIKNYAFSEHLISFVKQQLHHSLNVEKVCKDSNYTEEIDDVQLSDEYYYFYF